MPEGQMPQTYKQHPVPQNIMDVEFKLIGDLTIRQFGFVAVGGVIAFLAFKSGLPAIFRWPLAIISLVLGLGMAFFPIKDRGLDKWILNFFNSVYSPTQRVWRKEPPPPAYLLSEYEHILKSEIVSLAPIKSRRKLQEFLKTLPAQEAKTKLDIEEEDFIKKLDFDIILPESLRPEAVPIEEAIELAPKVEVPPITEAPPDLSADLSIETRRAEVEDAAKAEIIKKLPRIPPEKPKASPQTRPVISIAPKRIAVPKKMSLASEINFSERPVFTITTPESKKQFIPAIKTVKPGRKLTSLPALEGEIILPVRGEKIIPSFEDVERTKREALARVEREEVAQGANLLDQLKIATERAKQQFKEETIVKPPKVEEKLPPDKEGKRIRSQIKMLTSRVEELRKQAKEKKDATDIEKTIGYYQKQIEQLQKQTEALKALQEVEGKTPPPGDYREQLEETQKRAEKILSEIQKAKKEIEKLQKKVGKEPGKREEYEKKLQEQREKIAKMEGQRQISMETITRLLRELKKAQRFEGKPAPKVILEEKPEEKKEEAPDEGIPNIISGTVGDREGHLLENIVVLVKDKNDDPVRALKTNKLGRFSITTPLPNGKYSVEVGSKEAQFGIIRIELNGSVLKPLQIIEK